MTIEEIRAVVEASVKMRIPRFAADDRPGGKVGRLEDYILACAHMRGDLEEAKLWASKLANNLEDQWNDLIGWEEDCEGTTVHAQNMAKRMMRRDLYEALRDARGYLANISDQIRRLECDERTNSRAYTYITGQ